MTKGGYQPESAVHARRSRETFSLTQNWAHICTRDGGEAGFSDLSPPKVPEPKKNGLNTEMFNPLI
jgi:hypothetical protein